MTADITIGYYITRGRRKARVLCTDGHGGRPLIGYVCDKGSITMCAWFCDGRIDPIYSSVNDIVSKLGDKPVIDWSKEPAWCKSIAMDASGVWHRFAIVTMRAEMCWVPDGEFHQAMHPNDYPLFQGHWDQSLAIRPEGGAE